MKLEIILYFFLKIYVIYRESFVHLYFKHTEIRSMHSIRDTNHKHNNTSFII